MLKVKNTNLGRSMLEMLGVLAIIGVLSIAALYGYRLAMDSYHANEILNEVGLARAVVTQREDITYEADYTIDISELKKTIPYDMSARLPLDRDADGNLVANDAIFAIEVDGVPEGVCKSVLNKTQATDYSAITIVDEDHVTIKDSAQGRNICEEINNMQFLFRLDGQCEIGCPAPKCCWGKCCDPDETCHPVTHDCVPIGECEDDQFLCGADCCPIGNSCCGEQCCESSAVCCNGQCCERDKCTGDSNTGECCTKDKNGVELFAKDGICCPEGRVVVKGECVCPAISSGNAERLIPDKNGNCSCPNELPNHFIDKGDNHYCCPKGKTWAPYAGCVVLACAGGEGHNCLMNGTLCGYNCSDTADPSKVECRAGTCRFDKCPDGSPLTQLPANVTNGSGYTWFCKAPGENCYASPLEKEDINGNKYAELNVNGIICFNDDEKVPCCLGNESGNCRDGLCDKSYCEQVKGTYSLIRVPGLNRGGCLFQNNGDEIKCYPTNVTRTTWTCYSALSNEKCASNCSLTRDKNCFTQCSSKTLCPSGKYYKDGYCCEEGSDLCLSKINDAFYIKGEDGSYRMCGSGCKSDGRNCRKGVCKAEECPINTVFERINSTYYGCASTTTSDERIACMPESDYGPIVCAIQAADGSYYSICQQCSDWPTSGDLKCRTWKSELCAPTVDENTEGVCEWGKKVKEGCLCLGFVDEASGLCCRDGQKVVMKTNGPVCENKTDCAYRAEVDNTCKCQGFIENNICKKCQGIVENGICRKYCTEGSKVSGNCYCKGNLDAATQVCCFDGQKVVNQNGKNTCVDDEDSKCEYGSVAENCPCDGFVDEKTKVCSKSCKSGQIIGKDSNGNQICYSNTMECADGIVFDASNTCKCKTGEPKICSSSTKICCPNNPNNGETCGCPLGKCSIGAEVKNCTCDGITFKAGNKNICCGKDQELVESNGTYICQGKCPYGEYITKDNVNKNCYCDGTLIGSGSKICCKKTVEVVKNGEKVTVCDTDKIKACPESQVGGTKKYKCICMGEEDPSIGLCCPKNHTIYNGTCISENTLCKEGEEMDETCYCNGVSFDTKDKKKICCPQDSTGIDENGKCVKEDVE